MGFMRVGVTFLCTVMSCGISAAVDSSAEYKQVGKALEDNAAKIKGIQYQYRYSRTAVLPPGFFQGSEIWGNNNENLGIDDVHITSTTEIGTISVRDHTNYVIIELDREDFIGQTPNGTKSIAYRLDDDYVIALMSPDIAVRKTMELAFTPDNKPVVKANVYVTTPSEQLEDLLIDVAVMPEILSNARIRSFNYHLENMPETTIPLFAKSYVAFDGDLVMVDERPFPLPGPLRIKQNWKIDAATSMPVARNFYVENSQTSEVLNFSMARYTWNNLEGVLVPSTVTVETATVDSIRPIEDLITISNPSLYIKMDMLEGTKVQRYEPGVRRVPVLQPKGNHL